jgi:hypothetical protein
MTDFFGYQKEVKSTNQLASSEFALFTAGTQQSLIQSVQANYAQEIRPLYEVGSPSIYWVSGHSSGTVSASRLVGISGFLAGLRDVGSNCGRITPVQIQLSGGGACYASASGGLTFDGAVVESVNFSLTSGQIEITEGFNLRVANMAVS